MLTTAWNRFAESRGTLRPAAESQEYRNIYSRGFLLSDRPLADDILPGWRRIPLGSWDLRCSPLLRVATYERVEGVEVAVLGVVFGISSTGPDGDAVARRIAQTVAAHGSFGSDPLWDYLEALSGRFVVLISTQSKMFVVGDPMGSLTCYWHRDEESTLLASHTGLISERRGVLSRETASWVLHHPDYVSPGGKALPALASAHDGVGQVYPNCYLEVAASGVSHHRFYPRKDLPELTVDNAFEKFRTAMRRQVSNWLSVEPVSFLGLTGGYDSRTVMSSSLDLFQQADTVALTYHSFKNNPVTTKEDLLVANQLALCGGLRHFVMDVKDLEPGTPMADLYNRSFPSWARYPGLASSLYQALPIRSTLFNSLGGEIGTGFYLDRGEAVVTPEVMAAKYTYTPFKYNSRLIKMFEEYADFTEFPAEGSYGVDPYDLFYWEHRMGKWASLWFSECDLTTVIALPFNSRPLLEAMLTLPPQKRFDKELYGMMGRMSGI